MKEYHYTECGLDNIYLVNGFTIKKLKNGEETIHIHDIHKLHTAIGKSIVFKRGLLTGKEVQVRPPPRSGGLDGYEQPQGLPMLKVS